MNLENEKASNPDEEQHAINYSFVVNLANGKSKCFPEKTRIEQLTHKGLED